jgi:hypothetical protein
VEPVEQEKAAAMTSTKTLLKTLLLSKPKPKISLHSEIVRHGKVVAEVGEVITATELRDFQPGGVIVHLHSEVGIEAVGDTSASSMVIGRASRGWIIALDVLRSPTLNLVLHETRL